MLANVVEQYQAAAMGPNPHSDHGACQQAPSWLRPADYALLFLTDLAITREVHNNHSDAELIPARESLTVRTGQGLPWMGRRITVRCQLPVPGRGRWASIGPSLLAESSAGGRRGLGGLCGLRCRRSASRRGAAAMFVRTAWGCAAMAGSARCAVRRVCRRCRSHGRFWLAVLASEVGLAVAGVLRRFWWFFCRGCCRRRGSAVPGEPRYGQPAQVIDGCWRRCCENGHARAAQGRRRCSPWRGSPCQRSRPPHLGWPRQRARVPSAPLFARLRAASVRCRCSPASKRPMTSWSTATATSG